MLVSETHESGEGMNYKISGFSSASYSTSGFSVFSRALSGSAARRGCQYKSWSDTCYKSKPVKSAGGYSQAQCWNLKNMELV